MIVLKQGKIIHGMKIFKAGEILPDSVNSKYLIKKGLAEYIKEKEKDTRKKNKSENQNAEIAISE